jgi:hypothetical protein
MMCGLCVMSVYTLFLRFLEEYTIKNSNNFLNVKMVEVPGKLFDFTGDIFIII